LTLVSIRAVVGISLNRLSLLAVIGFDGCIKIPTSGLPAGLSEPLRLSQIGARPALEKLSKKFLPPLMGRPIRSSRPKRFCCFVRIDEANC
jgi:hypothetical protein